MGPCRLRSASHGGSLSCAHAWFLRIPPPHLCMQLSSRLSTIPPSPLPALKKTPAHLPTWPSTFLPTSAGRCATTTGTASASTGRGATAGSASWWRCPLRGWTGARSWRQQRQAWQQQQKLRMRRRRLQMQTGRAAAAAPAVAGAAVALAAVVAGAVSLPSSTRYLRSACGKCTNAGRRRGRSCALGIFFNWKWTGWPMPARGRCRGAPSVRPPLDWLAH